MIQCISLHCMSLQVTEHPTALPCTAKFSENTLQAYSDCVSESSLGAAMDMLKGLVKEDIQRGVARAVVINDLSLESLEHSQG